MLLVHRSRLIRAGACVRILIRLLASYLQQQSRVEQQQEHREPTIAELSAPKSKQPRNGGMSTKEIIQARLEEKVRMK